MQKSGDWKKGAITYAAAIAILTGAVVLVNQTWTGREVLEKTAKDAALQAVQLHSAPPVRQVHPDAVDAKTLGDAVHKLETVREVKFNAMDRKLDKIGLKLDALVLPDPRAGGTKYTRRKR